MGFLDAILGGRGKLRQPSRERLFAMTTAQIGLESLGLHPKGAAGIVFQSLATADFKSIVSDCEQLLESAAKDSGTRVETADDQYGFRWIVLRNDDFEDLVVALNMVASELEGGGYGDRLLCAVFPFNEDGRPLYFIYNFKRGSFYPFVPAPGDKQRNTEREFQLKAQVDSELPIEAEMTRWFPLWDLPL